MENIYTNKNTNRFFCLSGSTPGAAVEEAANVSFVAPLAGRSKPLASAKILRWRVDAPPL